MVEVYTQTLRIQVQSTTGGIKYRLFKRQRLKANRIFSLLESNI